MKYLLALFLTLPVYSATTASLVLTGNIPQILEVEITPETLASNLPLDTSQTQSKVATLRERSNSRTGYSINFSSTNQGKLVRSGGTEQISYNLHYGVSSVNLTSGQSFSKVFTNAASLNTDLKITYTAVDLNTFPAGNYTDTITVTITAN